MKTPRYSIQQYLNVRSSYFPNFSPSGERLAFLTDITGTPQVWQVALDLEGRRILWPDQVTFGNERVFGAWFCPADENLLLYGRDVGGNENMQFYLLSLNDGVEIPLTAGHENAMHTPGGWSPDGSSFLFAANRRHPGLFDVYEQPLDGEARLVWQNPQAGFIFNMAYAPDGKRITVTRMANSSQTDLLEIDLASGAAAHLTPAGAEVVTAWTAYHPDGRSLLAITDLDSDFLCLARFDLAEKTTTPILQVGADIEAVQLSADGDRVAYAINREGTSELYLLDLETKVVRPAPALGSGPGMLMGMRGEDCLVFAPDGRSLAIAYTGANAPPDIYLWDLEEDEVFPVTRSAAAGIAPQSLVSPELICFPTFDNDPQTGAPRQIPAWLFRPKGASERLPVVVVVHGGPEGQFRPNFRPVEQYLVNQGYAVLAPNVRGSSGYGKAYGHLDDVRKRMDSVADLAHAAKWLQEQPEFDSERIAVMGGSYGGFMVLSALTTYPDLWAAGVDIVGISNFVTFLENTSEYRRAHRAAEYGTLEDDRDFLQSISPGNHLEKIQAPLMVIHGANDPRVPLSETLQLVEKLESRGVPVEKMIFDDEGHGLVKLKNKLAAYPAVAAFLERFVQKK